MMNRNAAGHMSALLTIVIWGTTFISTKILLTDFQPVEILFFRFVLGLLALLAAFVWACYSVLIKRISGYGYSTILTTRRIFCYGVLFMLPALFVFDFRWEFSRFLNPVYLLNIVYLGLGASALCFVTWNLGVRILGAMKTSAYIYMVPVITVAASALILHEDITVATGMGIAFTMAGLFLSNSKS